jgi:gliding motility-associated lipoprotein GldH
VLQLKSKIPKEIEVINHAQKNRGYNSILLLLIVPLFWACGNEVLVDKNIVFDTKYWDMNTPFETAFEVTDTINNYNFFVTLRNTDEYAYQNLFVFLNTKFPNGKNKLDTINCPLANMQGKWLGKGFGGVYDNRVLYMARKRFPIPGKYTIRIEQAMRDTLLLGVLDVGLRIEQAP